MVKGYYSVVSTLTYRLAEDYYIRTLRTLVSFFTRKQTATGPEAWWDLLVTAGKELLAA